VILCALATAVLAAGPFPPVGELPSRPELPDPLVSFGGKRVTTAAEWEKERRPELKELFRHYMYGHAPPAPEVHATVERQRPDLFGGKATLREMALRFGPAGTRPLHLLIVTPNHRAQRAPVFVGPNFCGNHALVDDPGVRVPEGWMYPSYPGVVENHATEAGRGMQKDVWNIEQSVDRGYGVATFYNGDVEPDRPNAPDGVIASYRRAGETYDWGAVAAWAWGISRAVDYLLTDPAIDGKRIAAVGHSRNGKAAMLAAAFDERIALAVPLQAGCGGTSPSRGKMGESVQKINESFPHWFNEPFKSFNEHPERLAFDQHCLIALAAPRPVLLSNAEEDTWANPQGQFEMLQAADPVYRLLGVEGLAAKKMPAPRELVKSRLGYFIRPGKHSMTLEDWSAFLEFADRNLGHGNRRAE
jgi:hypothetical protein